MIAAQLGMQVQLVSHKAVTELKEKVGRWNQQHQWSMQVVDGSTEQAKQAVLAQAELIVCAAAAGVRLLSQAQLQVAKNLMVLADVNAVPPSAVEGINPSMDGEPMLSANAVAIGAMAIGQLKYQTQMQLLKQMLSAEQPLYLAYNEAFEQARAILAKQ